MIFDTHCHLNDPQLFKNIDEILSNAHQSGVTHLLVVGWDIKSSKLAIEIAQNFDGIYAAVGIYPSEVSKIQPNDFNDLKELLKKDKVVAIGEIGLDYHWEKDINIQQKQKEIFIKQIDIANEYKLPIIVHNRDAFNDCLEILKTHKPQFSGTVHCFSGSVESMQEVIKLDMFIGLDGPLTFKNAKTPKEVCEKVPLEHLLIETDSPYLAPEPLRGTINEPRNIRNIIDAVAEIKQISKKHIMDATFKNACRLFKINYEEEN